ncbi:MAG: hypothetical protein IJ153_05460 [Clostridia bacterium]|nr:hypothetical protein [Clostridia bacterium]
MISYVFVILAVSCFALGFLTRLGIDKWASDREAPMKDELKTSQETILNLRVNDAYRAGREYYLAAYEAPSPMYQDDNTVRFPQAQAR